MCSDGLISEPDILRTVWSFTFDKFLDVPRNMASVLSGFNCNPFIVNQFLTACVVLSMTDKHWRLFVGLNGTYIWVSSAYWWWRKPNFSTTCATGDMNSTNSIGPSTEPWGTPNSDESLSEHTSPILTHWYRSDKYEDIQFRVTPCMPNVWPKRRRRVPWSIVSNAADISNATSIGSSPLSADRNMSFSIDWIAVSVEWFDLNPDCLALKFLDPATCDFNLARNSLS